MVRVSKCCCFPLETGCYVIAILGLIGSIAIITNAIVVKIYLDIGTGILVLLMSFFLGLGVYYRRPPLILAWMILDVIGIIFSIVGVILSIVALAALGNSAEGIGILVALMILYVVAIILSIYFFIVVISFYKEIKET